MKRNEELVKIRKIFNEAGLINLRHKEERKSIVKAQKAILKKIAKKSRAI